MFGNLFLGEVLSPLQWVGVCLTLISIYLINQRERLVKDGEKIFPKQKGSTQSERLLESSAAGLTPLKKLRVTESESEILF